MTHHFRTIPALGGLAWLAAAAACSHDLLPTGADAARAPVTVRMSSTSTGPVLSLLADEDDPGHRGWGKDGGVEG